MYEPIKEENLDTRSMRSGNEFYIASRSMVKSNFSNGFGTSDNRENNGRYVPRHLGGHN